jgi:hypothetical protein
MRKANLYVLGALLSIAAFGCSRDEFEAGDAFVRVFEDNTTGSTYYPLGISATENNGGIVWAGKNTWAPHAIWFDAEGGPIGTWTAPPEIVAPASGLLNTGNQTIAFAMDPVSLATIVLDLSTPGQGTEIKRFQQIIYPLFATKVSEERILLISFNRFERRTVATLLSSNLEVLANRSYNNLQEIDAILLDHVQYRRRLPVFAGETENGNFYFNGFVNYTLCLIVTRSDLSPLATFQGTQYKGGVSGLLPLGGGTYAFSRFLNDQSFYAPSVSLPPGGTHMVETLGGQVMFDWQPATPVFFKKWVVRNKEFLFRLVTNRSGQLQLSVFEVSGNFTLLGTRTFGGVSPLLGAGFYIDRSDRLTILTRVQIAGSFTRCAIVRLSPPELYSLCQLED